jgi:carbamoyltransferase
MTRRRHRNIGRLTPWGGHREDRAGVGRLTIPAPKMWILGLAGSHNGAACLVRDGRVVVAIQAERIFRKKRKSVDLDFIGRDNYRLIRYCLDDAGIDYPDLQAIATCTPWAQCDPVFWHFEKNTGLPESVIPEVITVPHHLAHAEYTLHYSPVNDGLALVLDGSGTFEDSRPHLTIQEERREPLSFIDGVGKESISAYALCDSRLELIYRFAHGFAPEIEFLHSLGHVWRWAAQYCCGSIHDAGKVMGLSAFGDPEAFEHLDFISLDDDGRVQIRFANLLDNCKQPNLEKRDITGSEHHEHVAAHVQHQTNTFILGLARFLSRRSPTKNLFYSGGIALNGIANEVLINESPFEHVFMNGSCEDNGTAIGAALAAHHRLTGERQRERATEFYGRRYSASEIDSSLKGADLPYRRVPYEELLDLTARAISAGKIVGWFQGGSEFGPRALGNRSILADPRSPTIRDTLNLEVKKRESFRPFAPAVLEDRAQEFFRMTGTSPMMLRVAPVRSDVIPAVTHVDGTGRVQTVRRDDNPRFYDLIERFGRLTGIPIVLNTSFNVAGEPIVETPEHAIETFEKSGMDVLVMGDFVADGRLPCNL